MESIIDTIERIIHVLGSFGVFGILWVEVHDILGWKNVHKLSKRKWRRYWRRFWDDSKRYARKK